MAAAPVLTPVVLGIDEGFAFVVVGSVTIGSVSRGRRISGAPSELWSYRLRAPLAGSGGGYNSRAAAAAAAAVAAAVDSAAVQR